MLHHALLLRHTVLKGTLVEHVRWPLGEAGVHAILNLPSRQYKPDSNTQQSTGQHNKEGHSESHSWRGGGISN